MFFGVLHLYPQSNLKTLREIKIHLNSLSRAVQISKIHVRKIVQNILEFCVQNRFAFQISLKRFKDIGIISPGELNFEIPCAENIEDKRQKKSGVFFGLLRIYRWSNFKSLQDRFKNIIRIMSSGEFNFGNSCTRSGVTNKRDLRLKKRRVLSINQINFKFQISMHGKSSYACRKSAFSTAKCYSACCGSIVRVSSNISNQRFKDIELSPQGNLNFEILCTGNGVMNKRELRLCFSGYCVSIDGVI